nr:MAG TPA: hypothetical protein [Caudoviricetes sp.]
MLRDAFWCTLDNSYDLFLTINHEMEYHRQKEKGES